MSGVWWRRVDFARSNDIALYRLHCYKDATAIDIGALVVTLFGIFTEVATGSRMCRVLTFFKMKHSSPLNYLNVNQLYIKRPHLEIKNTTSE